MALRNRHTPLSSQASVSMARGLDRFGPLRRLERVNLIGILAAVVALVLLAYLLNGQPLLLLTAVFLSGAGVDGLLRTNPRASLRSLRETALYIFVPITLIFGAGVFFRYTLAGFWQLPAAALSGLMLGAVMDAEYRSVNADTEQLWGQRLILNLAAYLAAFALYTALYNQQLALPVAAGLVGLVSFLIGIEILREAEVKTRPLLLNAGALGFVMAEVRWALNFISLSGWLGGVFILVVFYITSQVMQSYLWGRLEKRVLAEYALVAIFSTLLVIAGRILSHG
jgi:hypothetical protein